jgi:hypothetical protein
MITQFKIFENLAMDEDDLVEQFSQDFVEEYYENDYDITVDDAANYVNIWNYVDIQEVKSGLIEETIADKSLNDEEFKKIDYCLYIEDSLLTRTDHHLKSVKSTIEKFRKKYDLSFTSDEDVLDKMDRKDLINIIQDEDKSQDFMKDYYEQKWDDLHPEEILTEIWGKHTIRDDTYSYISKYVNGSDVIDAYFRNIEYESKNDYLKEKISTDFKLQKKLIKMNPNNVIALLDVMDEVVSIGTSYKYQKLYLETVKKEWGEGDEEVENDVVAEGVKSLNDKFGLDSKIEEEYTDFLYLISAEKYNL